MALNKVILMGRMTADPELKTTPSGVSVTNFTLAVDRRSKGEEKLTDFIPCQAWRQTAEFVSKYFKKGNQIAVVGSIQVRNRVDQNGQKKYATDVVVDDASFCESKKDSETNSSSFPKNSAQDAPADGYMPSAYQKKPSLEELDEDGDLPF
jgi:single-strand DNA-binding protein